MTALFPDAYFHIGGDECNGKEWDANPQIQAYMHEHGLKDNAALQSYFHGAPAEAGRRAPQDHGGLGRSAPARYSEGRGDPVVARTKGVGVAARQGNRALLSNGYYIDLNQSAAYHYSNDPLGGDGASLTAGAKGARAGRRSHHVERVRHAGEHRQPHLAAHCRDRRASLVAAGRARCGLDVRAARGCFAASSSTTA